MPLRVSELRMPIGGDESEMVERAIRRSGLNEQEIESVELVRKSVDRRRRRFELVYTFDLHLAPKTKAPRRFPNGKGLRWVEDRPQRTIAAGSRPLSTRPLVVGMGPAGLFAAVLLARAGFRPIILERGSRMNHRVGQIERFHRDAEILEESNYLFGEGGAGTFSDGKLTTRSKDPRARFVLEEFRRQSGLDLIGYYYRPHLGSDRVRAVVGKLRKEILSLGGEVHYDRAVDHLIVEGGVFRGVSSQGDRVAADICVLAPGHSARDLYRSLDSVGVQLEPKPFQMGLRVEHPQNFIDAAIYGDPVHASELGPADYRLVGKVGDRSVFSFCMCPGGEIIPCINDAGHYNTNGMSYFRKDTGFANSGVVTTIEPKDFGGDGVFAGMELQERIEARAAEVAGDRFSLPTQRLDDFLEGRPSDEVPETSCRSGRHPARVDQLLDADLTDLLGRGIRAFSGQMPRYLHPEAIICGPEARSSAPVRIVRDHETLESDGTLGLYPVGEGAGYAGGIVSAAIDGCRAAESVISRFAPPVR